MSGRYFGDRHQAAAGDLARFLTASAPAALSLWLGADTAGILRDPDRFGAILDHDIATIDAMLNRQIDAILHHPRLTRLEGSWRGLDWLASRIEVNGRVRLRVLHASWPELCRDLERAPEFDQSNLFRRIYEDEFGSPGGEPYGLMVMDYDIRHRPGPGAATDDVAALAALSAVAAAAFSPMVFGAAPALLGVDRIDELSGVLNPAAIFAGPDYQRFRNLGNREDMRFVGIALPRLRARPLWDEAPAAQRGFRYAEQVDTGDDIVWFAAGYAIAFAVARAMTTYEWPADMRGYIQDWPGSGLIEAGTAPHFSPDPPEGLDRFETELALTDAQERALVDAGLMALSSLGFGGQTVLGAARSLQTPRRYAGPRGEAAEANARLSAQFNTIVCVARFAHFIKVMGRDMTGAFRTAAEIERELSAWLRRYTNANRDAGAETRARYPLLDASVQVRELPAKPGSFGCTILLQPHYQLDDIAASFRLVTELSAPGVG
ncbi:type VI secretion system contractile sheath large subunit [Acidiphilium iwatense]|uniref:Type VI secretion system contractile sheath large subunit n=1 Tax=Acidiphilium iwatense TaxID=768198 RepID=A0ABS9DXZ2_9PROT|nr:type VI secretion system contractile sheath large subunit [Acidiphilium sp. AL]MCF3947616.1 type VI secretion system contractile sheath large subunit [Acidiphilium iwatense]